MSDLERLVARGDEDRWLAARLAPKETRARLIAIYAVNYEIAKTAETVREPQLARIRLAWWRETIEEIAAGKEPRAHPAAQALAAAHKARALPLEAFLTLVAAREGDFQSFTHWRDLEAYVDATAGGVLALALAACAEAPTSGAFIAAGGRAWGYAGLARAAPYRRAQGRPIGPGADDYAAEMIENAHAAHADARRLAPASAAYFPAYGYLALAPGHLRALAAGKPAPSRLARQLRLIGAAAIGQI